MRRRHRHLVYASMAMLVVLLFLNGASGTILFARAKADPLKRADAIVVLGGEHDGREAYGLKLAKQGYADTVLLSNPYPTWDKTMKAACEPRGDIRVICRPPVPSTTRGEALMTRELADRFGWNTVIVISWRYHLPRARKIFDECFSSATRHVIMRDVPRVYLFSVAEWQYTYLYQYGGWVKAEIVGCSDPSVASAT
ncbi:YdcF family protein [Mycolicibacterium sp. BiH015]|uniref:YdcF family protein n=1 Tax=Mycolicibacterium sp. BiH015 TaxID=3018808 RepID=UPI0022E2436E|nr:YdcF family protein [Mycolicibacterium sp. BiH015]MDA2895454.1 YdcF family protein [Mycolicibacterium sp. BiH015]